MSRAVNTTGYASHFTPETHSNRTGNRGLPRDEVQRLAARIADGDREARNHLVKANLGLVWQVARRYVGWGLVIDDLVGEGNLGLIRAAEEFDPSIGASFSTYATYWIKQSILSAVMNTANTIRVPAHVFRLLIRWRRTEKSLGLANGRAPSCDEVASEMGLNEQQTLLVTKALRARDLRLESVLPLGTSAWPSEMIADAHEAPEALLEADEERNCLLQRLGRLDSRERTVLILRYGLGGDRPMKLHEVGRRLDLSKEWVRKIADHAIRKLVDDWATKPNRILGSGPRPGKQPRAKARGRRSRARRSPTNAGPVVEPPCSDGHFARQRPDAVPAAPDNGSLARCG